MIKKQKQNSTSINLQLLFAKRQQNCSKALEYASRILQGLFQEEPITAFKRNRNLKELIGNNCIENGNVKQAKHTFTIYHKVKCKNEYVIYLIECTLFNKQ